MNETVFEVNMLLGDIYSEIGEFGHYQILQSIAFCITGIIAGAQVVAITFLGAHMDHQCEIPELSNLSLYQQRKISLNLENDLEASHSFCHYYDLNYTEYAEVTLHNWNSSDEIYQNVSFKKCDNWLFDSNVFTSTLMNRWNIVCDKAYLIQMAQTVLVTGVLLGCVCFGYIADKFGRKKAAWISSMLYFVFALPLTYIPLIEVWLLSRFIVGACVYGSFEACYILAAETTGMKGRSLQANLFQIYFAIGVALLSGLAYIFPDFYNLQLALALCALLQFPSYYFIIDESPRWLVAENRDAEALQVLKRISKYNNKILADNIDLSDNRSSGNQKKSESVSFVDLLKTKNMRITTVAMWLSWFSVTIGYYGTTFGVSILKGNLFLNNSLSGLVEIPAYIIVILLVSKFSRKKIIFPCYLCTAIFCLVVGFMANVNEIAVISFVMIAKFFSSIVFSMLYLFASEVFPTLLRTIGLGTCSMFARVGGLIQPQIVVLGGTWTFLPFIIYGALTLIGCIATLFLPETLNKRLPETLEEAENFRKSKPIDKEVFVPLTSNHSNEQTSL